MLIKFKKLHPEARTPTRAKDGDAGYDLYAIDSAILGPFQRTVVKTGIAVEIPRGYYGRVAPRSGLAVKKGVDVLAGVIDSGYRDEIGVVLINLNMWDSLVALLRRVTDAFHQLFGLPGALEIKPGDKIAQLIIEKCHDVEWEESAELSDSERGTGGFGSTG